MPVTLETWAPHHRRGGYSWAKGEALIGDIGIFAISASGFLTVPLIGSLPVSEIVIVALLPYLLWTGSRRAFRREYLWFYVFAFGWLFNTVVSDIYLGTPLDNKLKGVARVVFLVIDFIALSTLLHNARRLILFTLGMVVVFLVYMRVFWADFLTAWKFGGSSTTTLAVLLVASYFYRRRRYSVCILAFLALAALNLLFAFRSQVAILLASLALTVPLFSGVGKPQTPSPGGRFYRLAALAIMAGAAIFASNAVVGLAIRHHLFSEDMEEKFQSQEGGKFGILVGGRPEMIVAIQAIRDSPLIGHGSYAVDPKYFEMEQDVTYKYGYSKSDVPMETEVEGIPTHSHLTAAWVESGLLGGLFWIYVLSVTFRAIVALAEIRPWLTPLVSYFLVGSVWDIVYSPFGSVNRMWSAFLLLLCYWVLYLSSGRQGARRPRRPSPPRRADLGGLGELSIVRWPARGNSPRPG